MKGAPDNDSGAAMTDDCRIYHSERARAELDMALKAETADAARAHYRLASLHRERSGADTSSDPLTDHRL